MHSLTSPERIKRSLSGGDFDKIPCFFRAQEQLCLRLQSELKVRDSISIAKHFNTDAWQLPVYFKQSAYRQTEENDKFYDIFGNRFHIVRNKRDSCAMVDIPVLAPNGVPLPVDSIPWPDASALDIQKCIQTAAELRESGLAVFGGLWASLFTRARDILGEETFFVSLYDDPEYVHELVARITDYFLETNKQYLDHCGKYIDIYYFGSDFGTQRDLFISPEHFRVFFKPHMKRITQQAKGYGLPVMFHTCGNVTDIIDDLIECGIDVLDPVQVSADNMSPENLTRFKGRIAFNGGISTQTTLPFGTPEDVRTEVTNLIKTLGPDKLIVAPDQEMIGDVPTENIAALYETVNNAIFL